VDGVNTEPPVGEVKAPAEVPLTMAEKSATRGALMAVPAQ
jgi:hypothetical protein